MRSRMVSRRRHAENVAVAAVWSRFLAQSSIFRRKCTFLAPSLLSQTSLTGSPENVCVFLRKYVCLRIRCEMQVRYNHRIIRIIWINHPNRHGGRTSRGTSRAPSGPRRARVLNTLCFQQFGHLPGPLSPLSEIFHGLPRECRNVFFC